MEYIYYIPPAYKNGGGVINEIIFNPLTAIVIPYWKDRS